MKYLFVFLLVGLTSLVHAQTETAKQPNCDDIEGIRTTYYSGDDLVPKDYTGIAFKCKDGKVLLLYNYKEGKRDGLWRSWHENGQLRTEKNYKDGKGDGLSMRWYENGQLQREYNYKDGKRDGLWRGWYANGQLEREKNYKDGKGDGLYRGWHENGQLEYEYNIKDGKEINEKCWDYDGNEIKCD